MELARIRSHHPGGYGKEIPYHHFSSCFVVDGLGALLRQKVQQGLINPVRVCPRAPGISHLLLADDTLLFFWANVAEATEIKDALSKYARCMGQVINPSK